MKTLAWYWLTSGGIAASSPSWVLRRCAPLSRLAGGQVMAMPQIWLPVITGFWLGV